MRAMSYGEPPTEPTPLTGPPTSAAPNVAVGASRFPAGPPTAMPLAPPTAPTGPPLGAPNGPVGYPVVPPAFNGPLPGQFSGGGSNGGWGQGGPPPAPAPRSGGGAGRKVAIGLLLVLALLAGVAGGFGLSQATKSGDNTAAPQDRQVPELPQVDPNGGASNGQQLPTDPTGGQSTDPSGRPSTSGSDAAVDSDSVAAKVVPGVVNINTLTAQGQGAGTGITLTADGYIVTNNHVVRGATRIVVTDADSGQRYEAKVVGTAKSKDVAVIKLEDAKGLDVVKIGDSDSVKVGDAVVALGNAGGQGGSPSVVTGNVTALNRSITASDESGSQSQRLSNLIQTNANIVPGDSGGPLANADGEVIGINAAAASTNEVSTNDEGYAIPINQAMDLVDQIKAGKESDVVRIGARGVLGVSVTNASSADDPFGQGGAGIGGTTGGSQSAVGGATVGAVADGSGAAKAGVTAGSMITAVDGTKITSAESLTTTLARAKPGDTVKLTWTDPSGQSHTASVTLTAGPPD